MGEDIHVRPTRQIQLSAGRQELKAGLGQLAAALAFQHALQPVPQRMKVKHIGGGISELLLGQLPCPPIG